MKTTIVEGNSNEKDNVRILIVKGEKGDTGEKGAKGDPGDVSNSQIYVQNNDSINISHEFNPEMMINGYRTSTGVAFMFPTTKMLNKENLTINVSYFSGTFRKVDGTLIGTANTDYASSFSFNAVPIEYTKGNFIILYCIANSGVDIFNNIAEHTQINFFATDVTITFSNMS